MEIYGWFKTGLGYTRRALTNNSAQDRRPRWSPDGASIVFYSNRDGNYEIYKMSADGSNQTRLTTDTAKSDMYPVWSPDGSKIMWIKGYDYDPWEMNADGGGQRLVKAGLGWDLDWWGPSQLQYRVYIGPTGSDYGGNSPPFGSQRSCAIVMSTRAGLACVTVGLKAGNATVVDARTTYSDAVPLIAEVRAEAGKPGIDSILEERGPGMPPGTYNMPDYDPSSGEAYPETVVVALGRAGWITSVIAVKVAAAPAGVTARSAWVEERRGQLIIHASIAAVFTPEDPSRNLAPDGASAVVLAANTGKLLGVQ